jgi:hypothetical protein
VAATTIRRVLVDHARKRTFPAWVADASAPNGFAASNALSGISG